MRVLFDIKFWYYLLGLVLGSLLTAAFLTPLRPTPSARLPLCGDTLLVLVRFFASSPHAGPGHCGSPSLPTCSVSPNGF